MVKEKVGSENGGSKYNIQKKKKKKEEEEDHGIQSHNLMENR